MAGFAPLFLLCIGVFVVSSSGLTHHEFPEDLCTQKNCSEQGKVCGSDGITYQSLCELNRTACLLGHGITMVSKGRCAVSTLEVSDTHQAAQTLMFGKRGKIHCRFSGQVVQVKWAKIGRNGQRMGIGMPRLIPKSNTLRFRRVQKGDAGMYKCLAKSGSGKNIITTVKVTVIVPEALDSTVATYKVCNSEKLVGTGNNYTTRWHFDRDSLKCKPFSYSGRGGNENNFKDEFTCMRKCGHSAPHFDVCRLHNEPGLCYGYFPRWYYNSRSKQCELFVYGGCGGNANNFKFKEACDQACSADHVCKLKPEKGRCLGYFVQYFYNSTSGQCEKFIYGGCGGNGNRFPTLDMCQKTCKSASGLPSAQGKRGVCPPRRMILLFCGERDHLCESDTDCKGDQKCCFDGCRQACTKPVINQQKPGKCPGVTTAKQACEEQEDMCETDSNCPGTRKCCHNGCQRDCVIPQHVQRPKPGVCPVQDVIKPSLCKITKPECKIDEDCFGRLKCCFNGCFQECLATPVPRPKPGLCPVVDEGSSVNCSGLRDQCSYDSQCPGREKCCLTGCFKECTTHPVKKKLGECPLVDFIPRERCKDTTDKCKEDVDCPGRGKCCATGCLRQCITPPLRQKPGECPAVDFLPPESCEDTTNKCYEDDNCPGKDKCCDTGCLKECLTPPAPLPPKKGQCPKPWKGLTGICDRKGNECSDDNACSGRAKCCYNGCQKECIEPMPVEKPGTCPKPWKGQDGICDRRGDMCNLDLDCGKAEKCCFNGCQRDCVKPEAGPSKKHGRCPKPWKEQPCDRRGDLCSNDVDCFGQFMCCHNGCQNDCVLPVNMTKCQQEKQRALDRLNLNPRPVGVFVPKCKRDGHYEDEQCQELNCWCVDRHGIKIPGTEVRGRTDCFAKDKPGKCPRPWKGQLGFCDRRGDMCLKDNECPGDNRCCFNGCQNDCVPPVGTKLCNKHKQVQTANTQDETAFIPSCKLNGEYEDIQCHGSTGYCWCVDKFGNEIPGTRTKKRPNCTVKGKNVASDPGKSGTCPKPWKGITGFCDKMRDQCGMDLMCPGEEKCCFSGCQRICVNSTESHQKRGTKPGECPKPWFEEGLCDRRGDMCQKDIDCKGNQVCCFNGCQRDCVLPGLTTCQQRYEESFLFPPVGRFVPRCKEDGNFADTQCHASTGHCWCVDGYGLEQLGTRIRGRPNCTVPDPCLSTTCDYYGRCVPTKDRKSVECKCNIACFLLHDPVCGTDGQTYGNECEMKSHACLQKQNIKVAYKGKCAAVDLCSAVKCGFYADCDIVNGSVQCSCPGSGSRPDCINEKKPVCGSNGKIYDNLCYLMRESCQKEELIQPALPGICEDNFDPCRDVNCSHSLQECTLSDGKPVCSCSVVCASIYDPVCGTDGKTYSSDCVLKLSSCKENIVLSVDYKGECRKLEQISRLSVEVDPCANVTCSHPLARCMIVNGTAMCQCPFVMTLEYFPVCGSDRVTYPNPSSLDIASCNSGGAIIKVKNGPCSDLADPCEISLCSHKFHTCKVINNTAVCICSTACTLEYDPVCGTNNKTYPNRCSLEVAECEGGQRLRVAYKGECGLMGTCPAPWKGHNGICDRRGDMCQDNTDCHKGKCCFNGCQRDCVRFGTLECTQKCNSNARCIELTFGGRQCICNPGFHGDGLSCSADPCSVMKCDFYATCLVHHGVGKCVCPAICPAIYLPVCGSDGNIYDNDCQLRSASCTQQKRIVVASKEKCKLDPCATSRCSHPLHKCIKTLTGARCMCPPSICTREFIPVCGSDGNTYPNQCVLKATGCERSQNISVLHQGECKKDIKPCDVSALCTHPFHQCVEINNVAMCVCPMIIPTILDPVCGSDGQTYSNPWALESISCLANRIVEKQRKGACPTLTDPCDISLCSHKKHVCRVIDGSATCVCHEICPLILQPVCGSDGMSYPNLCSLEVESCKTGKKLQVVRRGQCDHCANIKCGHPKHYCKVVNEVATCVCSEICPLLWRPVCGSDGKMYPNKCSLLVEACKTRQDLTVVKEGECPKPECPLLNPTPVCSFQPDTCLTGNKTCDSGLVCCADNDCTIKCTLPALPDGSRPGQCPVLNRTPTCGEITGCDKDERCPLGERCCLQKDCTRKCIKAEFPPPPSEVTSTCPILDPTPSCRLLPDASPTCFSGGPKCPVGKACCLDSDCTHKCVRPALSDGSRPGQCPVLNRTSACGEITGCDKDERCPLGQRCCLQKDCSRKCIKTEFPPPALRLTSRRQSFLGALTCVPPCHPFAKCIRNHETGKLECSCKRPCPRHYSPVCGTDGKTYGNDCMLKFLVCQKGSDVTLKHPGKCKEAACPVSLCSFPRPICKVVKGRPTCFCRKICPAILDPVCGSDGRTYDNMCLLEKAACIYEESGAPAGILTYLGNGNCTAAQICSLPAERGRCRAAMRRYFFNATSMKCQLFKFGGCEGNANRFDTEEECNKFCGSLVACQLNPCPDPYAVCTESVPGQRQCACPKICPEDYSPVCGTDGNTYNNECLMKVTACKQGMMIYVKSNGSCKNNPGVCRPVDPRPCPEDLFDECFDDSSCEDSEKCCYDGCRKSCAFSLPKSNFIQPQSLRPVQDSTSPKASCKRCLDFPNSCEPDKTREGDCEPVCGTDGRNYSSYCLLLEEACKPENVGVLKLKHRGPCVCDLPLVAGPCFGYMPRYFFNSTSKQCEKFIYGGCLGNGNRFTRVDICEDMCISPCKNHKCPFHHSPCEVEEGRPVCKCPIACPADYRPVCGTDGRTYGNLCGLETTACRKEHLKLQVRHVGECFSPNPCEMFRCKHKLHKCVVKQNHHPVCICRKVCTREYKPVCSSDGKTYPNKCTMDVEGCESGQNLKIIHDGYCGVCDLPPVKGMCEAYMPSFFFNSTSKQCERFIYGGCGGNGNRFSSVEKCAKKCRADSPSLDDPCQSMTCKHHGVCHVTEDGMATCKCITDCPDVDEPVCGSDGKTYSSECVLKSRACLNKVDVHVVGGAKKCSKRMKCKACPARYDLFSHFCNSDFVLAGKLKGIESNQTRGWSELTVFVTDVFKGPNPPQNRIVKIAFTENLLRCYCKELDQLKTKSEHEILVAGSMIQEGWGMFIDEWSYVHHFTHHLMHKAREITKQDKCARGIKQD